MEVVRLNMVGKDSVWLVFVVTDWRVAVGEKYSRVSITWMKSVSKWSDM